MKERSNPEVIKYLEDENAYTKAVMAHTAALQDRLYEELEIMIDGNVLAEGKPTFIIRAWDVSSAEDILAFAVDTTGGRVGIPRERGHEYSANHFGDYFYILSNDHAKNFRLIRTPVARPGRDNWEEVIPHRPECCSRTSSSSATTSC